MSPRAATAARTIVQAAGAIVWRVRKRKLEVLVVHRPRYDDWSWPKGKVEDGESLVACAVREVAEETGVHVALGQPLPLVTYRNGDGRKKLAHYWAAQEVGDGAQSVLGRDAVAPAPASEIDEARWVEVRQAADLLTYRHDLEPLGALVDQWHDERLRTWTMAVVRHARARKRSAWKGGEATRPLTPAGSLQSERLVPMLAAYGVEDVMTSPWERCAATVRPYLEATGIGAELRPELTEDAHARNPRPVRALIQGELTRRDVPVALCTHRPVLPTVVEEIARRTPHRIMRQVPESDPWLKTAEILVVHLAQRPGRRAAVVALEKHRPAS
ncbi:NUDIX hydrolase [Georgenia thermotolerans]|uniref:NUDIX domain-containing protein n=1 Tax=Georgenia thermotolerans TaxID=527326 RepID=A0A7J5UTW0_9MICO|nr:NUDIX hydrolase [Georgenia thermotolerans]KAE8765712.1 NUDIX domain-containing protein [Georgenia thermotolerans]